MVHLKIETHIHAPTALVFELARSVDTHLKTAAHTREKVVAGKNTGVFELGDEVTWEARHLGIRQRLSAKIVSMDPPHAFTDVMIRGAFASLEHRHLFRPTGDGTLITDELFFKAPWGPLGRLAEVLILKRHMSRFLMTRNQILQELAERKEPS